MSIDTVELTTACDDGLWGSTWRFVRLGDKLVVDGYMEWRRASKRHKPVTSVIWIRLNAHASTMKEVDVPFTPAIAAWAKREWLKKADALLTAGFHTRA